MTGPIGMLRVKPIKSPVLSLFSDMSYFRPVLNNLRDFVAHFSLKLPFFFAQFQQGESDLGC